MNKKSILLIIVVVFSLVFTLIASAEINLKTPAWQKAQELGKKGSYTFLFVGNEQADEGKIMLATLREIVGRKAALVKIAPADPREQELVNSFRVKVSPTVIVVAPNGAITGYFTKTADKRALSGSLVSLKEAEALKILQEGRAVFLCFQKETSLNIDTIKADLNAVADNFKGSVSVLYVDNDDREAKDLINKMQLKSATPTVFILIPPGRAAAKLAGSDITKENLMRAFVSSCGGGSCGSGCK